jgi:hypothetical protein
VGPRIVGLATVIARRYGRQAAWSLVQAGRAWLADPANETKRRDLVAVLRGWATRAAGGVARSAGKLADEIERRRPPMATWERDVMALRHAMAEAPQGPAREAAVQAYRARVLAGARLTHAVDDPSSAGRRAREALDAEMRMLRDEPISAEDRAAAIDAVRQAGAACYGAAPVGRRT